MMLTRCLLMFRRSTLSHRVLYSNMKLAEIYRDTRNGLHFGIPLCCIFRYCWTLHVMGRLPALCRGGRFHDRVNWNSKRVFVPCGWFHMLDKFSFDIREWESHNPQRKKIPREYSGAA